MLIWHLWPCMLIIKLFPILSSDSPVYSVQYFVDISVFYVVFPRQQRKLLASNYFKLTLAGLKLGIPKFYSFKALAFKLLWYSTWRLLYKIVIKFHIITFTFSSAPWTSLILLSYPMNLFYHFINISFDVLAYYLIWMIVVSVY